MDKDEPFTDLTPVTVRCSHCGSAWEEFRANAQVLFHPDPSQGPGEGYQADQATCVFCNPTPGAAWMDGQYL